MYKALQEQIEHAMRTRTKVQVCGNGSKAGLFPSAVGAPLKLDAHRGITDYQPNELVIRARAGTPLSEIDAVLAEHGQILGCEPPSMSLNSTLGGAIACGWSGPARPWRGALRDQVLGVTMLNGRGDFLRFGGSVIKNVAGFDVSRLMVGSVGTLGVILEANLKVVPQPEVDVVLAIQCGQAEAIRRANQASAAAIPLSGAAWENETLRIRLSGNAAAVAVARARIGGEEDVDGLVWFERLRHWQHPFLAAPPPGMHLWRLSLPPATPPLLVGYPQLLDWGGGQRWLLARADAANIIQAATAAAGGYATCRRTGTSWPNPAKLAPTIEALNRRIKLAFDPANIFGEGAPPFA